MQSLLLASALILFQEKTDQFCWESLELYTDETFKEKIPEDSDLAKTFKKKRPKYEKTVKEEAAKAAKECGAELVECQKHILAGSGLKQVDGQATPYHFRIKLAYSDGLFTITLYVKVEVYRDGKLVTEFRDERSIGIFRALSRTKRKEAIVRFGNKIVRTMVAKVKEARKK